MTAQIQLLAPSATVLTSTALWTSMANSVWKTLISNHNPSVRFTTSRQMPSGTQKSNSIISTSLTSSRPQLHVTQGNQPSALVLATHQIRSRFISSLTRNLRTCTQMRLLTWKTHCLNGLPLTTVVSSHAQAGLILLLTSTTRCLKLLMEPPRYQLIGLPVPLLTISKSLEKSRLQDKATQTALLTQLWTLISVLIQTKNYPLKLESSFLSL